MKKVFVTAALAIAALSVKAQDTITVNFGDGPQIIINNDVDVDFENNSHWEFIDNIDHKGFRHHLEGVFLGVNNYLNADGEMRTPADAPWMKLNEGRSLNLDFYWEPYKIPALTRNLAIEMGFDLELSHYSLGKDFLLQMNKDVITPNYDAAPDNGFKRQNLRTIYFGIPLVAELQFGQKREFYLTGGIKGQLRAGSRIKAISKEHGDREKTKLKDDYNTTFLRYSYIGGIGFKNWQVFAEYSPCGIFKKDMGPELHPFSIGIKFN